MSETVKLQDIPITRRHTLGMAGAVGAVGALASLGVVTSESTASAATTELAVWMYDEPSRTAIQDAQISAFERRILESQSNCHGQTLEPTIRN